MNQKRKIAVADIDRDPEQPRKEFDEAGLLDLGKNVKSVGQLVPVIVYPASDATRFVLADGERRWRAAQLVRIKDLDAIVLPERPTQSALHVIQMSVEAHRAGLSAIERSDFLARIRDENGWSVTELVERLSMKQPLVTKLLKYQDGCEEVRAALQAGRIDQDKIYTICQEPDFAKQRELLKQASDLTREQLRQKARSNGQPVELRASVARFPLPTGMSVTIRGKRVTLPGAIEAMVETVKELKKGQAENWDITTAIRVMRDRSRAGK